MSNDKSRETKIIAHVSKSVLTKKFPDYLVDKKLVVLGKSGVVLAELDQPSPAATDLIKQLAENQGFDAYTTEEKRLDKGWITLDGTIYSVHEISDRKSAITFRSHNKDEDAHYAQVDKIVAELAKGDVAVLKGECSITLTTRC